jgi:dolichol-phosphate mannosyltransferase
MISLVIPCYNEAQVLELTYKTLCEEIATWADPVEILFIDDGSADETPSLIRRFAQQDARVRGVFLSRNFGHQAAVGAGLEAARGDAVVVLDADLQDPPSLIREMVAKWREGFEVVAAKRNCRQGESGFKKFVGWSFYRVLAQMTDVEIPKDTGDFALLDRRVVDVLVRCREHAMFWRGLRCHAGFRHASVSFDRPARAAGETKYTLGKLVSLASNGLLSYSELPLRLPLWLGVFGVIMSTVEIILAVVQGRDVLGVGLYFLGSVQLLALGVIGEYLNRIYAEVRNRPRWVVAETVGREQGSVSKAA